MEFFKEKLCNLRKLNPQAFDAIISEHTEPFIRFNNSPSDKFIRMTKLKQHIGDFTKHKHSLATRTIKKIPPKNIFLYETLKLQLEKAKGGEPITLHIRE